MKSTNRLQSLLNTGGMGFVLALMIVVFIIIAPHFATLTNLRDVFTAITINTVLATGETFVILAGQIDLSVGAVMALSAVVAAKTMLLSGISPAGAILLSILAAVAVGTTMGFVNGLIAETWRLPSFIVTLGTLDIARGGALLITNARTVFGLPMPFINFGASSIGGVLPSIFVVAILFVALAQVTLSVTVFGRLVFAIGTNENTVRVSGYNTSMYKLFVYAISGLGAAIAGILYVARLTIATPILGEGFELNAIAAVIIGGTSLQGGKGSVVASLFGACIIGVLNDGLILLGLSDFLRQVVTGLVIIIAVIIDSYRKKM